MQNLLTNLTQLLVSSHAQPPARPAQDVEISGGGGSRFDDHQVIVPANIDNCDPRIGMAGSALECEGCSEQLRVVLHEPIEVAGRQRQMIDSEEMRHDQPTVVRSMDGT